jgi:hypothetical protein
MAVNSRRIFRYHSWPSFALFGWSNINFPYNRQENDTLKSKLALSSFELKSDYSASVKRARFELTSSLLNTFNKRLS